MWESCSSALSHVLPFDMRFSCLPPCPRFSSWQITTDFKGMSDRRSVPEQMPPLDEPHTRARCDLLPGGVLLWWRVPGITSGAAASLSGIASRWKCPTSNVDPEHAR